MPEQALPRLTGDHARDDLVDAIHLLVAGNDLDTLLALLRGEGREAGQHVQHHRGPQHRGGGLLHLAERLLAVAVPPGPPHIDRHPDRAVAEFLAFRRHRQDVGHEQLGHIALVVVMHLECGVQPALARAHRRLSFYEHQRHAVDQQHQIGALFGLARADGELLGDDEAVLLDIVEVDQADGDVFAVRAEGHGTFAQEPGDKFLVRLH